VINLSERADLKCVHNVVKMARDNLFLRQLVYELIDYIAEQGIFDFVATNRQIKKIIRSHFATIAIQKLQLQGYDLNVRTPWERDAGAIFKEFLSDEAKEILKREEEDDEDFNESEYESFQPDYVGKMQSVVRKSKSAEEVANEKGIGQDNKSK
jgi:hypothetical protein